MQNYDKNMKNQGLNKDILILSIITTVTVAVWTALGIYEASFPSKTVVSQIIKNQTEPLDPKLDLSVIDGLENRDFFELVNGQEISQQNFSQTAPEFNENPPAFPGAQSF